MKREEIVKATHCPVCNAPAGQMCWDNRGHNGGKFRKRVHPARANWATGGKFNGKKRRTFRRVPAKAKAPSADFYQSWAWKEARYAAIKRHGRKCLCCGWSPSDGPGYLVVDHIKPVRTHPNLALEPTNLQVLCNDCNMGKSYKHTDDWR